MDRGTDLDGGGYGTGRIRLGENGVRALGETTEIWRHLWDELETQYNRNSQQFIKVTLDKTSSRLNWPSPVASKPSSGGIGTPTQPQTLQPTLSYAYKMWWDKDGAEIVRVTNQWLTQLETHIMRGRPSLRASGQKLDSSKTWERTKHNLGGVSEMILNNILLYS